MEEAIRDSNVKELLLRTKIANVRSSSQCGAAAVSDDASETSSITAPANNLELCGHEPILISLSTAFLVIHPNGVEIDAILAYLQQFVTPLINQSELHDVLTKNEKIFNVDEDSKWFYIGFKKMP